MISQRIKELNEKDYQTLLQFEQHTIQKTPQFDKNYLIRFLIARDFKLDASIEMWDKFIQWREENNIDQIQFHEIYNVRKFYPHGYYGVDNQVFLQIRDDQSILNKSGKQSTRNLLRLQNQTDFLNIFNLLTNILSMLFYQLHLRAKESMQGKQQLYWVFFLNQDLKGLSLSMINKSIYKLINISSNIGQNYYPETLSQLYIINAPYMFAPVFNTIKKLFNQRTQKKIQVLGSGYLKELKKFIDEENLPEFMGGSCKRELECNYGPWNPKGEEIHGIKKINNQKNQQIIQEKVLTDNSQKQENQEIDEKLQINQNYNNEVIEVSYQQNQNFLGNNEENNSQNQKEPVVLQEEICYQEPIQQKENENLDQFQDEEYNKVLQIQEEKQQELQQQNCQNEQNIYADQNSQEELTKNEHGDQNQVHIIDIESQLQTDENSQNYLIPDKEEVQNIEMKQNEENVENEEKEQQIDQSKSMNNDEIQQNNNINLDGRQTEQSQDQKQNLNEFN